MLDYQQEAIFRAEAKASKSSAEHLRYLQSLCEPYHMDAGVLINRMLESPITINFHPDRFCGSGETILDSLLKEGYYHNQFRTGTTNGGKSAYIGGERYLWEQRLFQDAYPPEALERPKYGALNLLRYIDGASMRFGSCFLVLWQDIVRRCTFCYGDSSGNPSALCTANTFSGVLANLLRDAQTHGRLLNRGVPSVQEAIAILMTPRSGMNGLGRNLDHCVEVHVHGDISLETDVQALYLDGSFRGTVFEEKAIRLCQRYHMELGWIPKRQLPISEIGEYFRGPAIPLIARKADRQLSGNGIINAALIGAASRDSMLHPENWSDSGSEAELFRYFKQLWHTVGYFG